MIALAAVAFCLLYPADAAAHSAIAGSDGFIAGLLHPLQDVLQALAASVVGLFIGQQRSATSNPASGGFIAGFSAGLATAFLPAQASLPVYPILSVGLIGGAVVALTPSLPNWLSIAASIAAGAVIGLDLVPGAASLAAISFTVAGSFCSVVLLFVHAAYVANWACSNTGRPWLGIGVRIAGSWIAAISVLMTALAARY